MLNCAFSMNWLVLLPYLPIYCVNNFNIFIINSDVLGTRNDGMGHPYTVFARRKDNKDLIQCLTPGCDGMGHSTGNYSTHRRYY